MKLRHVTGFLGLVLACRLAGAAPSEFDTAVATLQKSTAPFDRKKAAEKLGQLKDARAIPYLIEALSLKDPDPEKDWFVRTVASQALTSFGAPAVAPLTKAAESTEPTVRRGAVDALTKMKAPGVIEILCAHLKTDADAPLRTACIFNMRDLKDKKAIPCLREVAKSDKDPEVREKAGRIADKIESGQ